MLIYRYINKWIKIYLTYKYVKLINGYIKHITIIVYYLLY